jgi:hypothetical protein
VISASRQLPPSLDRQETAESDGDFWLITRHMSLATASSRSPDSRPTTEFVQPVPRSIYVHVGEHRPDHRVVNSGGWLRDSFCSAIRQFIAFAHRLHLRKET